MMSSPGPGEELGLLVSVVALHLINQIEQLITRVSHLTRLTGSQKGASFGENRN